LKHFGIVPGQNPNNDPEHMEPSPYFSVKKNMADWLIFISVNERAQCKKNACWVFETVQIILIIKSLICFTEKVYGSSPYSPRALYNEK